MRHSLILALLYFLYAVFVAYQQDWQARDIVWSMWIASLVGGYAYIVFSIAHSVFVSARSERVTVARGVFLLAFFTVHFGLFHLVHGQILQGFFPLAEQDLDFLPMLAVSVREYWPFLLVALLSLAPRLNEIAKQQGHAAQARFQEPYKAVIKNHLMIFVVAFANSLVDGPVLLYLLLILYFFPFEELQAWRKRRAEQPSN